MRNLHAVKKDHIFKLCRVSYHAVLSYNGISPDKRAVTNLCILTDDRRPVNAGSRSDLCRFCNPDIALPVLVLIRIDLEKYGLAHEPTVGEILRKGADVVCFSGDKLLGGPQAGIIVGKKEYIQKMEQHPLMRALRLDKCTTAVLEATFREYFCEKQAWENIPVLKMIARTKDELLAQAEEISWELNSCSCSGKIAVTESSAVIGGGSLPGETMPDYAVEIFPEKETAQQLADRLRLLPVPIVSHIKNDRVLLEMRTISEEEKREFTAELKEVLDEK